MIMCKDLACIDVIKVQTLKRTNPSVSLIMIVVIFPQVPKMLKRLLKILKLRGLTTGTSMKMKARLPIITLCLENACLFLLNLRTMLICLKFRMLGRPKVNILTVMNLSLLMTGNSQVHNVH